jgi:hypothetical protein
MADASDNGEWFELILNATGRHENFLIDDAHREVVDPLA